MFRNRPVLIIENDEDDQEFLKEVFQKLDYPNPILFFSNGEDALEYLKNPHALPFLILSDINMPKLTGLELRAKLIKHGSLAVKYIPYLFFSTAASEKSVVDAYSMSVQGFFVKPILMSELEKTISVIMEYWLRCAAPNNFGVSYLPAN